MVAEYHMASRTLRRKTKRARHTQPVIPDSAALGAAIRALWRKERRLGCYAPVDELCLDLDALEPAELQALKEQVQARLQQHLAARL